MRTLIHFLLGAWFWETYKAESPSLQAREGLLGKVKNEIVLFQYHNNSVKNCPMFCQKTAHIKTTDFAFQILTFQNPIWTRNMTAIQIMRYFFQRYKPHSLLTFSYMLPKLQLSIFPWLTHEHWQNYFMVQKKWVPVMGIDNVFLQLQKERHHLPH